MATIFPALTDDLTTFIAEQKIFFVASAEATSHINLSPKGMDSFRVLSPTRVAFLNVTGSGNETAAHLLADGRLTIMFCSFTARPMILRLYGRGVAIHPRDEAWADMVSLFPPNPGARQVIVQEVETVQTSCGFAVPFFTYEGEREALNKWAKHQGQEGIDAYWAKKNQTSMDGLPTGLLADVEANSAE